MSFKKDDRVTYVVNCEGEEHSQRLGKVSKVNEDGSIDILLDDNGDSIGLRRRHKVPTTAPEHGVWCRKPKAQDGHVEVTEEQPKQSG